MPHLRLIHAEAKRIAREYGLHDVEAAAAFLGLHVDVVRDVCAHRAHPPEEFIAAVLLRIPCRFDEVFEIVDDQMVAA